MPNEEEIMAAAVFHSPPGIENHLMSIESLLGVKNPHPEQTYCSEPTVTSKRA
jgi:hypothetical protein